ncbi:hypothetical protein CANMA_004198 [Candida margitis]|uniref:uncharacterized protein n=1 Tax=Candida margitis TaxID=1775924 RepID=UPI002228019D|nr:uncharacterized protein CANMA_004198 [Candida margitis]KAI5958472.1 hypothetical protein CANMA_004198 [Candida margitis]
MAKSILKDNTAPLPSTSRRVSFAPEVTLHRIEVFNPNKRRKTDGGASGASGYSSSSSQSDFEVVHYSTRRELENEGDSELIDSSNKINEDGEFDGSSDDGSKPLTDSSDEKEEGEDNNNEDAVDDDGVRSALPPANIRAIEVVKSLERKEEAEVSMELTSQGAVSVIGKEARIDALPSTPSAYASGEDADYSSNGEEDGASFVNNDEEEEMQLTERVDKTQNSHSVIPADDEPEDMQLTGPITSTSRRYRQASAGSDDDGDETINLTTLMSKVDEARVMNKIGGGNNPEGSNGERRASGRHQSIDNVTEDGSNMELTEKISRVVPRVPILKPSLQELPDDNNDGDYDADIPKNESEVNVPNNTTEQAVVDMEITEPVRSEVAPNKKPNMVVDPGSSESQDMELTQPVTKLITESQRGTIDDSALQNEEMELTQPTKSVVREDQPNKPAEEKSSENANGISSLSKVGDDGVGVTQGHSVVSMDITESQQPLADSQQSMELTQVQTVVVRQDTPLESAKQVASLESKTPEQEATASKVALAGVAYHTAVQDTGKDEKKEIPILHDESERVIDRYANYKQVQLAKFLDDIKLRFYTEIDPATNVLSGFSSTESTAHQPPSIHDLISAIPYKEVLALNEFIINELQTYIREGERVFQEFNAQISSDNPPIIKEFYTTNDLKQREIMTICLNNIKEMAKLESKSTWYKWKSTLVQNVIDEMERQIELLRKCQVDLNDYLLKLDEEGVRVDTYKRDLVTKMQRLKSAKQAVGSLSQDQANEMRQAFSQSKSELQNLGIKFEQANNQLVQLNQTLLVLQHQKIDLVKQVDEAGFEIDKNKKFTKQDKLSIKKNYDRLSKSTHLKYLRTEDRSTFVFLYDATIVIKLDFLQNLFQVGEVQSNKFRFKSLINYIHKFPVFNDGGENINPALIWTQFRSYWRKLVEFDTALYFNLFQFPVKVVENKENIEDGVIRFQVDYFDFDKSRRYFVVGSLAVASLLNYESSISFTVRPAMAYSLDDPSEYDKTLTKLGKCIDLPQCTYIYDPKLYIR